MNKLAALALTTTLAVVPRAALAWGPEGHRVIAQLAYENLTPAARRQVDELLSHAPEQEPSSCAVRTEQDAATWADCVRGRDHRYDALTPDHYENRPLCGPTPPDVCAQGCITAELSRAVSVLPDRRQGPLARLQALEEVEHFIGDLHQPMHMTDNADRGGNSVRIMGPSGGRTTNLHAYWDSDLVRAAVGPNPAEAVNRLRPRLRARAAAWRIGNVENWAAETHRIAVEFAYPALTYRPGCGEVARPQRLSAAYVEQATPIVADQLAKASVRLAAVLNSALK